MDKFHFRDADLSLLLDLSTWSDISGLVPSFAHRGMRRQLFIFWAILHWTSVQLDVVGVQHTCTP